MIKNTDFLVSEINTFLSTNLMVKNGIIETEDGTLFRSIRRALSHIDKLFEFQNECRPSRSLSHIAKNVLEDENYNHFEWDDIKQQIDCCLEEKDEKDCNLYSQKVIKKFEVLGITSRIGNECVKIFTTDGFETGCVISSLKWSHKVALVENDNIDLFKPKNIKHTDVAMFRSRLDKQKIEHSNYMFAIPETFIALETYLLAGKVRRVKVMNDSDRTSLALHLSKSREILCLPGISVDNSDAIDFVDRFIPTLEFSDRKVAIENIIYSCSRTNHRIPKNTVEFSASISGRLKPSKAADLVFAQNVIKSYFEIYEVDRYVVFKERFGSKFFEYVDEHDPKAASHITKYLSTIIGVKTYIEDIGVKNFEDAIHDIIGSKKTFNDSCEIGDYDVGGAYFKFEFDRNRVSIGKNGQQHTLYSKYLTRPQKNPHQVQTTALTRYDKIFDNQYDKADAIYSLFAVHISRILKIDAVFTFHGEGKNTSKDIHRYLTCDAFNFSSIALGLNEMLADGVVYSRELIDRFKNEKANIKIEWIDDRSKSDFKLTTKKSFSKKERTAITRIANTSPSRVDVEIFVYLLNYIAKEFGSFNHARTVLSDKKYLIRMISSVAEERFRVRANWRVKF